MDSGQKSPADKPDADGYYESFAIIVAENSPSDPSTNGQNSTKMWEQIIQGNFATKETDGKYRVVVRRFNLGHTFKRVQSQMSKVYTYVIKRREQLHIEEPTNISWQGILLMTFGAMSSLISIALGEFWESDDDAYIKGAGQKNIRSSKKMSSTSSKGSMAVHNGLGRRPSSYAYTYTGYPNMKNY